MGQWRFKPRFYSYYNIIFLLVINDAKCSKNGLWNQNRPNYIPYISNIRNYSRSIAFQIVLYIYIRTKQTTKGLDRSILTDQIGFYSYLEQTTRINCRKAGLSILQDTRRHSSMQKPPTPTGRGVRSSLTGGSSFGNSSTPWFELIQRTLCELFKPPKGVLNKRDLISPFFYSFVVQCNLDSTYGSGPYSSSSNLGTTAFLETQFTVYIFTL